MFAAGLAKACQGQQYFLSACTFIDCARVDRTCLTVSHREASSAALSLCQTTPNPLHFGGQNTLRCPDAYKPRDGKVFDRGERALSVSFAAQIPS